MPNTKIISFIVTVAISCVTVLGAFLIISVYLGLIDSLSRNEFFSINYTSLLIVLAIGLIHGLTAILVIRIRKSKSLNDIIVSTVLAGEIFLIYFFFIYFLRHFHFEIFNVTFLSVVEDLLVSLFWYAAASILFLTPSIIIGVINKRIFENVINGYKLP